MHAKHENWCASSRVSRSRGCVVHQVFQEARAELPGWSPLKAAGQSSPGSTWSRFWKRLRAWVLLLGGDSVVQCVYYNHSTQVGVKWRPFLTVFTAILATLGYLKMRNCINRKPLFRCRYLESGCLLMMIDNYFRFLASIFSRFWRVNFS